jgi:pimeloyl-ACP methyl ester carboxylesterase
MTTIPIIEFGGSGQNLYFLHANGYPPACYKPLLECLSNRYRVFGLLQRPLWQDSMPEQLNDWFPLSEDLLRFLSAHKLDPILGVGHSLGAIVLLRAALWEPARFRALVLIDPVLYPPFFIILMNFVRLLGVGERFHPIISGALKRRRQFNDLELVFRGYRNRAVFRYFPDEYLRAYISGITRRNVNGGYELVYTPEWEARIYSTGIWPDMDLWRGLKHHEVPTLIIRGAESDTFLEHAADLIKRKNPTVGIKKVEKSTHLLPLERPKEVSEMIHSFLKELV